MNAKAKTSIASRWTINLFMTDSKKETARQTRGVGLTGKRRVVNSDSNLGYHDVKIKQADFMFGGRLRVRRLQSPVGMPKKPKSTVIVIQAIRNIMSMATKRSRL